MWLALTRHPLVLTWLAGLAEYFKYIFYWHIRQSMARGLGASESEREGENFLPPSATSLFTQTNLPLIIFFVQKFNFIIFFIYFLLGYGHNRSFGLKLRGADCGNVYRQTRTAKLFHTNVDWQCKSMPFWVNKSFTRDSQTHREKNTERERERVKLTTESGRGKKLFPGNGTESKHSLFNFDPKTK